MYGSMADTPTRAREGSFCVFYLGQCFSPFIMDTLFQNESTFFFKCQNNSLSFQNCDMTILATGYYTYGSLVRQEHAPQL